jgi:hypothetical protein
LRLQFGAERPGSRLRSKPGRSRRARVRMLYRRNRRRP